MPAQNDVTLRSTVERELALVLDSGWRKAFPQRLCGQPFFRPVLKEVYPGAPVTVWPDARLEAPWIGHTGGTPAPAT